MQFDQIKAVQEAKNWKPGKKTWIFIRVGLAIAIAVMFLIADGNRS